jgi:hypothetical protein
MPGLLPDTSTYGAPAPPNVLGMLQTGMAARNMANQNALFQQEFRAKQALGRIAQQSVDPQSGQIDNDKFALGISTDPDAAFMAPQVLESMFQRNLLSKEITQKQLENNAMQFTNIGQVMAPLVAKGEGVTKDDAISAAKLAWGQGLADKDHVLSFLSALPDDTAKVPGPAGQPTSALASFIKQIALGSAQKADTLNSVLPRLVQTQQGGGTVNQTFTPATGALSPAAGSPFIPNTPTVGELNQPVETVNPAGQTEIHRQYAVPGVEPMVSGSGTPVTGTGQQPAGPAVAKMSPFEQAYRADQGKNIATYTNGVNEAAHGAQTALQTLNQQLQLLQQFRAGGGATLRSEMAKMAQGVLSFAPIGDAEKQSIVNSIMGGSPKEALAAAQEFEKYSAVGAMQALVNAQGSHYRPAAVEYQTIYKNFPKADVDPKASRDMIQLTRSFLSQAMQEQQFMEQYRLQHGDAAMEHWPSVWSKILSKSGRLGMEQKLYEGLGGKNFGTVQQSAAGGQ